RKRGARVVPDAIFVARNHTEAIFSGGNIRVNDISPIARIRPLAIESVENVLESEPPGGSQAQGGVLKFQPPLSRRKLQRRAWRRRLAIHQKFFDDDRRRHGIRPDAARIDDRHATYRRKPESSVRGLPAGGLISSIGLTHFQAIRDAERLRLNSLDPVIRKVV